MRRGRPAIAAVAIAGLTAALPAPAQAEPTARPPAAASAPAAETSKSGQDVSVTLITGDKVRLPGGDTKKVAVEPAAGRENVGFTTYSLKDHTYVIPADVTKDVGAGRIDRRLFDVTQLVKAGYDDTSTSTIPVLTTYAKAARRAVPKSAKLTRQLPSIGGAALKVSKNNAKTFLSTAGFSKLWLDGKRKLTLDQSVPQIGGPVAWQAGYTGNGVSVAVLDTGVDATHPDLATQIAGAKNFTTESTESTDDLIGHGTHVASTIAGTGAASGGKYKGVAPDAKIYDGKVCTGRGCADSAILAGMEWDREGTEIASADSFYELVASGLPAGKASYKLVATGTQAVLPFSTRIDLEATFTSSADQPGVAIHTVGFRPEVDGTNAMTRKPVTVLPVQVQGGPVSKLKVEYSDDAGVTWRQAPVTGGKAIFPTPAGKSVSLRSTATDAAGNTTTQTVIAAYNHR
ncbi:S8 family serine peptidase [Kribbella solani]|uniref:S8 family serine peptidase n=1 Tax=Kribbella solani TaxID=236067 RepID=UPI0029AB3545|nr:S8 family serine peptidase [Kribbella solani]MDX2967580.1 S8 family serine peptidase [Kribbella solani]